MALTPKDVDELYEHVKKLLEMWMKTKLMFLKAFGEGDLTREMEAAYLQLKSEVSRLYRIIADRLPPGLKFDGDKMVDMLKNAMTLDHVHQLPANERTAMTRSWHAIYIKLTRTLGALEVMQSGYYPGEHRTRLKVLEAAPKKKVA